MGSAPASGAVFRALAENMECTKMLPNVREYSSAKQLDARRDSVLDCSGNPAERERHRFWNR
jgi:hypothetical protein